MADVIKILRVICAVLGLVFSLTSRYYYWPLVACFTAAVVLELITLLAMLSNRGNLFSSTVMAIIEGVIGLLLLIFNIYILANGASQDTLLICAIVAGFILPAIYFISVYERATI